MSVPDATFCSWNVLQSITVARWRWTGCDIMRPGEGLRHREMLCRCCLLTCPRMQVRFDRVASFIHHHPAGASTFETLQLGVYTLNISSTGRCLSSLDAASG